MGQTIKRGFCDSFALFLPAGYAIDMRPFAASESASRQTAPAVALTIAGFDPSSGAGVTADLQVFSAHGLYGTAAITALTVQSTLGVFRSDPVDASLLLETLQQLQTDMPPRVIKIGMLANQEIVAAVVRYLRDLAERPLVVVDPVILSSSGKTLLTQPGISALVDDLLPAADWLTPNRSELLLLAQQTGNSSGHGLESEALDRLGSHLPHLHIVQTGGDDARPVDTLRLPSGEQVRFAGEHIDTTSTHGTGCAFSSALAATLVQGIDPISAVRAAKAYVRNAILAAPGLGRGHGPLGLSSRVEHRRVPGA